MKTYIYVVSIKNDSFRKFDAVRLFHNKYDAINFIEDQGFIHEFDDDYIKKYTVGDIFATIRLYEVEGIKV